MFKKILLAADGSKHSYRAAEKTVQLLESVSDGHITVVYSVDGQTSKSDVLHHFDKTLVEETRKKRLADIDALLQSKNIDHTLEILHGEPGPSIVEYANKHDFDMVVVGSRGLNGLQEMVLGSVSHKIAKRVKAPVLIVK